MGWEGAVAKNSVSDHTLILPTETKVVGTALRTERMTAPGTDRVAVIFARCPFCDELTSVEYPSDCSLRPVLHCDVTGKLFSVVCDEARRGYGGMQPLSESRHPRFQYSESNVAATFTAAPLGYVIRADCPYCGGSVQVLNEDGWGSALMPQIRCEGAGKTFGVYFPEIRADLERDARNPTGRA